MVAFNASKFVCWAIELMTLLTLWISRLDVSSFFIPSLAHAAKSTASFEPLSSHWRFSRFRELIPAPAKRHGQPRIQWQNLPTGTPQEIGQHRSFSCARYHRLADRCQFPGSGRKRASLSMNASRISRLSVTSREIPKVPMIRPSLPGEALGGRCPRASAIRHFSFSSLFRSGRSV